MERHLMNNFIVSHDDVGGRTLSDRLGFQLRPFASITAPQKIDTPRLLNAFAASVLSAP